MFVSQCPWSKKYPSLYHFFALCVIPAGERGPKGDCCILTVFSCSCVDASKDNLVIWRACITKMLATY